MTDPTIGQEGSGVLLGVMVGVNVRVGVMVLVGVSGTLTAELPELPDLSRGILGALCGDVPLAWAGLIGGCEAPAGWLQRRRQ